MQLLAVSSSDRVSTGRFSVSLTVKRAARPRTRLITRTHADVHVSKLDHSL